MLLDFYVLRRDWEFQVVSVTKGNDPLHGYGSWNIYTGPFNTWHDAAFTVPMDDMKVEE